MTKSMAYVAKKSCGCFTMAIVDTPERKKEVVKQVAKALQLGEIVERMSSKKLKKTFGKCAKHRRNHEI
jgi:hypothetical protein